MEQMQQASVLSGTERRRVETVLATLARLGDRGESVAEVAHDARNMVTALGLYCDLLEEPGVLTVPFVHYASELRLVAASSRRLVEKLVALDCGEKPDAPVTMDSSPQTGSLSGTGPVSILPHRAKHWDLMPSAWIDDLAEELQINRNLLAALVGTGTTVTVDTAGGALAVRLTGEDLTRILVNLVKNAVEAMPSGGIVQIVLREGSLGPGGEAWVTLNVADNGRGIPLDALEKIFEPGYSTRSRTIPSREPGTVRGNQRGLGLSITRSIVEAAGGRIHAANRDPSGACFQIELPIRPH